MAQITRNVKTYSGQVSFTAGIPTVADWNSDFDTIVNGANAHDAAATAVHAVGAGAVVSTTLAQTLTNKTLTSPTLTTPTLTAPVLSGTATGTGALGGSIVVPLARVAQLGSFTTASLAASGTEVQTIAYILPDDDVMVLLMAAGNTIHREWAIHVRRSNDGLGDFFGRTDLASLANTPATGNVNIKVTNTHTSAQTITVRYAILRVN